MDLTKATKIFDSIHEVILLDIELTYKARSKDEKLTVENRELLDDAYKYLTKLFEKEPNGIIYRCDQCKEWIPTVYPRWCNYVACSCGRYSFYETHCYNCKASGKWFPPKGDAILWCRKCNAQFLEVECERCLKWISMPSDMNNTKIICECGKTINISINTQSLDGRTKRIKVGW